jgi:RNA polymerase sigma factor (sigma-70 family)
MSAPRLAFLPKISTRPAPETSASNVRLVHDCLNGKEEAWRALIDRFKSLIYSVPLKYGLTADDAAEIFQSVCLSLLSELGNIRDPQALPAWLIQVTARRCATWRRDQDQVVATEDEEFESHVERKSQELSAEQVREIELEQMLREGQASLTPQCRRLIEMLFYESPARPYDEVAAELGLATGSIGFTRQKCLEYLRKNLEKAGFVGK